MVLPTSPTEAQECSAKIRTAITATQVRPVAKVTAAEVKSAGSAGVKGYGDDTYQSLANDYNTAVNASAEGLISGDAERAGQNGQLANRTYAQLTDTVWWSTDRRRQLPPGAHPSPSPRRGLSVVPGAPATVGRRAKSCQRAVGERSRRGRHGVPYAACETAKPQCL